MSIEEFSNEFDVLVDSYKRIKKYDDKEYLDSIEFNEYEKSIFLTKALEELILSFYTGKNTLGDSFEKTEEIRRYLSSLIKTSVISDEVIVSGLLNSFSKAYQLPNDIWFITYEAVTIALEVNCIGRKNIVVVPITLDDYYRTIKNPFRQNNSRKALRLDLGNNCVEIITKYPIDNYTIRYLVKPKPIILTDLHNNLSIDNLSFSNNCELHPALHRVILENAVKLALLSKINNSENNQQNK